VGSISRIGPWRNHARAAIAAAALIAAGGFAIGGLDSYVDFEGESVGVRSDPDRRLVVGQQAPPTSRPFDFAVQGPSPVTSPSSDPVEFPGAADERGEQSESDGSGSPPSETLTANPGAATPQDDSAAEDGDSPEATAVPPTADPQPTPPVADVRPVSPPVEPPPATPPPVAPVEPPAGPLTATTTALDDTLGTLGVDLPVAELTGPATEPLDGLLRSLGGSSG